MYLCSSCFSAMLGHFSRKSLPSLRSLLPYPSITIQVVVGVVFNPVLGELFTATLGGGARLNGKPISCSQTTELGRALMATEVGANMWGRRSKSVNFSDLPTLYSTLVLMAIFLVHSALACHMQGWGKAQWRIRRNKATLDALFELHTLVSRVRLFWD